MDPVERSGRMEQEQRLGAFTEAERRLMETRRRLTGLDVPWGIGPGRLPITGGSGPLHGAELADWLRSGELPSNGSSSVSKPGGGMAEPKPPTFNELVDCGRRAYNLAHLAAGGTGPDAARAGERAFTVAILERLAQAGDSRAWPGDAEWPWPDELRAIPAEAGEVGNG